MMNSKDWTAQDIVALRRRLRMTQYEFANALGVWAHSVSRWEVGDRRPSLTVMKKLDDLERQLLTPA